MDDGEIVNEPAAGAMVACLARNKPVHGTRNLHIAHPGADHALCGTLTGEVLDQEQMAGLRICFICRGHAEQLRRPARPDSAPGRCAPSRPEPDEIHDWKASIVIRADGLAEVALNGYSELLNSLIKDVPGRRWDRDLRVWTVPRAWVPDLTVSLSNAGVEVRTTEQRTVVCTRCRQECDSPADLAETADFS